MKKKKIVISLGIILLILLVAILIWWYYPVTRIDSDQLIPKEKSIELQCLTDPAHPLRAAGIQLVSAKAEQQLTGFRKNIVRFGLAKAFPEEIRIAVDIDTAANENKIVAVIDFGRGIRAVRWLQPSITHRVLSGASIQETNIGQYTVQYITQGRTKNENQPCACTWIDSGLIVSNNLNLLTELVSKYRTGLAKAKPTNQPDGVFFISNKNQELSEKIKEQEKKLEYAIFPTIDAIDHVEGMLTMQDADKGTGKIMFYMTQTVPQEKQSEIESDVEFFKNVLRRIVRSQNIDLTATVSIQGDKIEMEYQISGLNHIKF
jgi:hypothetical protein